MIFIIMMKEDSYDDDDDDDDDDDMTLLNNISPLKLRSKILNLELTTVFYFFCISY
jgi:hypothetical protein